MKTNNFPQILIPLILLTATLCVWFVRSTGGDKRELQPIARIQVEKDRAGEVPKKAEASLDMPLHMPSEIAGTSSLQSSKPASDRAALSESVSTHSMQAHPVELKLPEADDFVIRQEARSLETELQILGAGFDENPFERLTLPLFDEQVLLLDHVEHHATGPNRGLFTGAVPGEPHGGHVILSYVNSAIAATVHLPAHNEFYEIRTAPNGTSHILSRLDPTKMPPCGHCNELNTEQP